MFGIGFFELVVIAIVALVFVGPKKLPEFMKTAGKFFVQMRRTANDVRSTFDQVIREAEDELRREEARNLQQALMAATQPGTKPSAAQTASLPAAAASPDDGHNPDGTLKTAAAPEGSSPAHAPADGASPASQNNDAFADGPTGDGAAPTGVKPYRPSDATSPATEAQWSDRTGSDAGAPADATERK